jgi:hypothetical protein
MGLLGGQFQLGGSPTQPATPASVVPVPLFVPADPLGVDVSSYPDLDPLGTLVSGLTALCQRIARRLTNPRGAWFWSPNECTDLRAYMNEALTIDAQASIKAAVEREALREEEVQTANADVSVNTLSSQGQSVTIHLTGTTKTGPFQFVLAVTAVTLSILKAG